MKARLNGTKDPFVEITEVSLANKPYVVYDASRIEFEQQQEPTSDHWQDVRERAAMMALSSIIPMKKGLYSMCDEYKKYNDCAEEAIRYADALVEKLKGVSTYQDNQ